MMSIHTEKALANCEVFIVEKMRENKKKRKREEALNQTTIPAFFSFFNIFQIILQHKKCCRFSHYSKCFLIVEP